MAWFFPYTNPMNIRKGAEGISLKDFFSTSFEKKCDVVTCYSNYITTRQMGHCKIYLYHTGRFFIEVYYSTTYKKVLMIHALNDMRSLEPYVDEISLAGLGL